MSEQPDLEELDATVARMETRWTGSPQFAAYRALCARFEADLPNRRDLALAKSAALMLIKFLNEET